MSDYKVQLDAYTGPMDLLLYLIRRDEVDIQDIPIARITEQYLQYVAMLQQIDPDSVGEFLVMAATLMEIKSRWLLPKPEETQEEELIDPRSELVRQLLEYKRFKDAAAELGEAASRQAQTHPRAPAERPKIEEELDLDQVHIWDLFGAFNKLMAAIGQNANFREIIYDDTPIDLHQADIVDRLERQGPMTFADIFQGRTKRSEMIGLFLALLELMRQGIIRVEQDNPLGDIYVSLRQQTGESEGEAGENEQSTHDEQVAIAEDTSDNDASTTVVDDTSSADDTTDNTTDITAHSDHTGVDDTENGQPDQPTPPHIPITESQDHEHANRPADTSDADTDTTTA